MRIYLCGAINGCTDAECADWRNEAKAVLAAAGHEVVDPMDRDCRGLELDCGERIVEDDKDAINGCTHLLVNYGKPSVGTAMEVLHAWERGKQVVLVCREARIVSPWMLYHVHHVFNEMRRALDYLCAPEGSVTEHPTSRMACSECGCVEAKWQEDPPDEEGTRNVLRCCRCNAEMAFLRSTVVTGQVETRWISAEAPGEGQC